MPKPLFKDKNHAKVIKARTLLMLKHGKIPPGKAKRVVKAAMMFLGMSQKQAELQSRKEIELHDKSKLSGKRDYQERYNGAQKEGSKPLSGASAVRSAVRRGM